MKYFSLSPLFIATTFATFSLSPQNHAATLEEVLVTAQKREQSLQDVPIAVTAYDNAALNAVGVLDITELQRSAPNTVLQVSRGTNSTLTAYIRGIGQADPLWGFEPGVGLYVDDVYFARPQSGVLDVYDVERIEILRGPQGTLYGKNTIGGAIKYVTKRLQGEKALAVQGAVGSYDQRDISINGELPLADNLSLGGAIARFKRDGFGEFLKNGDENYNKDVSAARLSLEYTPTDQWFFRLTADKTVDDSNAKGGHRLTPSLRLPEEPIPSDVFDSNADLDTNNEVKSSGGALTVIWDVNEHLSLKSITAYREGDTDTNIDFDNTSLSSFNVTAFYADDQLTQEFQINYNQAQFHWVGGLYYYEGNAIGAFDIAAANFNSKTAGEVDTTSYSAYVHMNFDVSDHLSVSLGGRYTQDKKEAEVFVDFFVAGNTLILTDYTNDDTWREFSPKLSVEYRPYEGVMIYSTFSQGFKSGGFDMRGNATVLSSTVDGFDPEIVDTWELGLKSELFERRLRLNVAAFYSDYTDMQVSILAGDTGSVQPAVINAGEAEVQGIEVEAIGQINSALSLTATIGYLDTEFTEVITGFQSPDGTIASENIADTWGLPYAPDWTAHLAINYLYSLGGQGDLDFVLSGSYRGETRIFPQAESLVDEEAYTLVDASVVWHSADEHWDIGLHAKNITDREYRVGGYNFLSSGGESSVIGYYGNPRTLTLTTAYRF